MSYHPIMIAAHIQDATAPAITRRAPKPVWPLAVLAGLSLCALLAVLMGIANSWPVPQRSAFVVLSNEIPRRSVAEPGGHNSGHFQGDSRCSRTQ